MTDNQVNKFLTLLMGECWHEWQEIFLTNNHTVSSVASLRCKHCETDKYFATENYDYLSNPLFVIRWMEKEMPEVLNGYVDGIFVTYRDERWGSECLMEALNLKHLVVYLLLHPEWGEKECPQVNCQSDECRENPECNGTGRIIHPALQWAREVKDAER